MSYYVNDVPLDNPEFGWALLSDSKPIASVERSLASVSATGTDGVLFDPSATAGATFLTLVVETPRTNLEALKALFMAGGVLTSDYDAASAEFEFASASATGFGAHEAIVRLSVTVRVPAGVWRSAVTTSEWATVGSASVPVIGLLPNLSAPVQDAVVRLRGPITGARVMDSGGSWFEYLPAVPAGSYLRFESESGGAFVTTSDTWTGGTDVSGVVTFGGPRGVFELTPFFVDDPSSRAARMTVYSTARGSGAAVQVQGAPCRLL